MLHFIFTLDYEIYGNGSGSLRELVYEPTERLASIFREYGATFVVFAEVAEFEKIEEYRTDEAIEDVKRQLRLLYEDGFEIGLHLHPQWYNGRWVGGRWILDRSEYNLCTLPQERIKQIVGRSINYLRRVLGDEHFVPVSFRAGNWLFQPTIPAARVLHQQGIRVDSSVFKGGRQRSHGMDYRRALNNGSFWRFCADVNVPDPQGRLLEIPIYTEMRPFWEMLKSKRVGLQRRGGAGNAGISPGRILDFLRLRYPRKLDFCRMTFEELKKVVGGLQKKRKRSPELCAPIVAIGHSKDFVDFEAVGELLSLLREEEIPVLDFEKLLPRLERCEA